MVTGTQDEQEKTQRIQVGRAYACVHVFEHSKNQKPLPFFFFVCFVDQYLHFFLLLIVNFAFIARVRIYYKTIFLK